MCLFVLSKVFHVAFDYSFVSLFFNYVYAAGQFNGFILQIYRNHGKSPTISKQKMSPLIKNPTITFKLFLKGNLNVETISLYKIAYCNLFNTVPLQKLMIEKKNRSPLSSLLSVIQIYEKRLLLFLPPLHSIIVTAFD